MHYGSGMQRIQRANDVTRVQPADAAVYAAAVAGGRHSRYLESMTFDVKSK